MATSGYARFMVRPRVKLAGAPSATISFMLICARMVLSGCVPTVHLLQRLPRLQGVVGACVDAERVCPELVVVGPPGVVEDAKLDVVAQWLGSGRAHRVDVTARSPHACR